MTTDAQQVFGTLQQNWSWLLAVGILFVVLGVIGLGMLFQLTMMSVMFFGVLLLIGGGAQFVDAFKCKGWKGVLWHVLMAILYIIAGITVIRDPVLASALLTLLLGGAIAGAGIVRVIMALQHKGTKGWSWDACERHYFDPAWCHDLRQMAGLRPVGDWPLCCRRVDY